MPRACRRIYIYIYTRICVIKTLASTHASRTFWIFSSTSLLLHDSFNDSLFMQIVWSGGEGKSWSKGRKGEIDVTRIEDLSLSTRGIIRDFIIRYFSLVIFLIADDSLVVQFDNFFDENYSYSNRARCKNIVTWKYRRRDAVAIVAILR